MDLIEAVRHSNTKEGYNQVEQLLKNGADINFKNTDEETALMLAAQFSNTTSSLETVKLLLKYGADVNFKNTDGETALILAAGFSNDTSSLDTVKVLLNQPNIDINLQNDTGFTALMWAAAYSNDTSSLETVKLLIDHPKINVNLQDRNGWTALMFAAKDSNDTSSLETVELLLNHPNININVYNNNGQTILMMAATFSNHTSSLETVKLMLEYGADPYLKDEKGKTAFDLCPTDMCKQTIERYIYKNRYSKTFPRLAAQYSSNTPIPTQIWDLIFLRKDQQKLCQDLATEKYKGALLALAEVLEIPIDESLTKNDLCNIISQQLTLGRYYKKENIDLLQTDKMVKELASRYGININQPLSGILDELSLLI